ncbi:hypothetical protein [Propionicimonas sp.]|uniref:hypothetical protein n=1 Tax=Propionicimonas sp. TaxID=1955623 RepID=UPI0039E67A52
MRAAQVILLTTAVVCGELGSIGATTTPAAAAQPAAVATPCGPGTPLASDFDGDGVSDLVVGAYRGSARVQRIQPGDGGAGTWLTDSGELRTADLNGDACADAILFAGGHEPWLKAALGTPDGLDVAGAVEVTIPQAADIASDARRSLAFEAASLRHDGISQIAIAGRHVVDLGEDGPEDYGDYVDVLTLDDSLAVSTSTVLPSVRCSDDCWDFGSALVASGRTIAVGHPSARVSKHYGAGEVLVYSADTADPTQLVLRKTLTQNSANVPGTAEEDDHFGATLALRNGRLAIGAPGESDGRLYSAGLVQPILWKESSGTYTAYRAITQDTKGVPGSREKNDQFGASLAIARGLTASGSYDILIGATEAYGRLGNAGSVTVANVTKSLYRGYTQATKGIPGNPQAGDAFFHVGVLQGGSGIDTVLIGAPGEDSLGVEDYGRAIRSDGKKLSSKTTWTGIAVPSGAPSGTTRWGFDFGMHA